MTHHVRVVVKSVFILWPVIKVVLFLLLLIPAIAGMITDPYFWRSIWQYLHKQYRASVRKLNTLWRRS